MNLDEEKNEKFLRLVEKHQYRLDDMDYEFYDLDTPSFGGKIEQAIFVFEVLEMNHLLEEDTVISNINEYLPSSFNDDVINGFTFLRDNIPYYISLNDVKPREDYRVLFFGRTEDKELMKKENQLIEIFELFQKGNSLRMLHRI